jgi:hypothetical protein
VAGYGEIRTKSKAESLSQKTHVLVEKKIIEMTVLWGRHQFLHLCRGVNPRKLTENKHGKLPTQYLKQNRASAPV